jgi:UDP-glucose 4-epimerase
MRVLVTGGAGFIGANVVRQLVHSEGVGVTVLDDLSSGSLRNLEDVPGIDFLDGPSWTARP